MVREWCVNVVSEVSVDLPMTRTLKGRSRFTQAAHLTQSTQQLLTASAIHFVTQTGLFGLDGDAAFVAEYSIDDTHVMASLTEQSLDFAALGA